MGAFINILRQSRSESGSGCRCFSGDCFFGMIASLMCAGNDPHTCRRFRFDICLVCCTPRYRRHFQCKKPEGYQRFIRTAFTLTARTCIEAFAMGLSAETARNFTLALSSNRMQTEHMVSQEPIVCQRAVYVYVPGIEIHLAIKKYNNITLRAFPRQQKNPACHWGTEGSATITSFFSAFWVV